MNDLNKVSSEQLFLLWKNLTIGLLTIVVMITFTKLLPYYLSPIISLLCAAGLYTLLYNHKYNESTSCMLVPYIVFFCLISYSFVTIILNILHVWGFIFLPGEFIFFSNPYVPSLLMCPICFIVVLVMYFRRNNLRVCAGCALNPREGYENGKLTHIMKYETTLQIKNLLILFGGLTVVIWSYYLLVYINININSRDWYIFTGLLIISFILDELYFIFRFYNLYLDLKENDEIITPEELSDMTAKTYLRFYVVCGNYMYVDNKTFDPKNPHRQLIDTPFFTKRSVNGITIPEVDRIIRRMSGVDDGELKFFFGRRMSDMTSHSILRYFYFLNGEIADYPQLNASGVWMDFDDIKKIYMKSPGRLSNITVTDITRLATIMLTEKIFDEDGFRKSKIKKYSPSFNLMEVRKSDIDFQDDKWIKISMFNSDTSLYRFKRWWRGLFGKKDNTSGSWG